MEFEEQSAALRQMKELLRDQTKFRAKLDRVVRRIETSSQRTARLAERNRARKQTTKPGIKSAKPQGSDGDGHSGGASGPEGNSNVPQGLSQENTISEDRLEALPVS